jgi:transposase-like protein
LLWSIRWIAQEVADRKEGHDASRFFRESARLGGKVPSTLITDGLNSYGSAFNKVYSHATGKNPEHVREITLAGRIHNNKMERMNGEVRDSEKVMRGLKVADTPVLKGYQIFHNFIRPHEALKGQTPADVAGIKVHGDDKWLTLIQNATVHPTKVNREDLGVNPTQR